MNDLMEVRPLIHTGGEVEIGGNRLECLTYNDRPVVTLAMIGRTHNKERRRVWENFDRNRDKFFSGEDYVLLPYEEWSALVPPQRGYQKKKKGSKNDSLVSALSGYQSSEKGDEKGGHRGDVYLFFDSGYLMLVKTFTDDLSWSIQRQLVRHYFSTEKIIQGYKDRITDLLEANRSLSSMHIELIQRKAAGRLTLREHQRIVEMRRLEKGTAEIAAKLGRSKSAVSEHTRRAREKGELPPSYGDERLRYPGLAMAMARKQLKEENEKGGEK